LIGIYPANRYHHINPSALFVSLVLLKIIRSLKNDNKSHPKCQEKYHNEPQIFASGICKMQVVPEHNSQLVGLMKTHGAPSGSRYECTGVVMGAECAPLELFTLSFRKRFQMKNGRVGIDVVKGWGFE
jgi:hypothetical protein